MGWLRGTGTGHGTAWLGHADLSLWPCGAHAGCCHHSHFGPKKSCAAMPFPVVFSCCISTCLRSRAWLHFSWHCSPVPEPAGDTGTGLGTGLLPACAFLCHPGDRLPKPPQPRLGHILPAEDRQNLLGHMGKKEIPLPHPCARSPRQHSLADEEPFRRQQEKPARVFQKLIKLYPYNYLSE